ncbi:MAG: CPBP family intramembrane metalloprotease [Bacteroidales bacterium]|nr:CPBP family intramembrane metalloprotease [Bacteroidales bacterium]MBR5055532.1 CPBP family intramembrane metalloprotease [Bacteroidales bacterium]
MAHRKIQKNYEFFSNYDYYTPGPAGMFTLLFLLLAGALLGGLIAAPFTLFMKDSPDAETYAMLISYPIMFIPPMIYASYRSRGNSFFGKGYKLSNKHYSPLGIALCAVLVIVATLATSFLSDSVISLLPPMPEWLEKWLSSVTQGNLILNFLCVSIFAPFFEEWLCRGMVLRGLLNYEHKNKAGETVRGLKPVWAIVISAAFFALIHFNSYQAIAAFAMGLVFGYVYYRTGSIWLTMLMHFANNTFALILSNIDSLKDIDSIGEVLPAPLYWAIFVFCIAFLVYFVKKFLAIKPLDKQGSCAEIVSE